MHSNETNDHQLVRLLKQGDEDAFATMVSCFKSRLFRVAYGITHDNEESLDIVQDVFLKAFEKMAVFREEAELSTWLYRITINHCLNWRRKWKRRFRWHHQPLENEAGEIYFNIQNDEQSAENLYHQNELKQIIEEKIRQLPEDARTIFILKEVEELSYEEIAHVLKIKKGTVSSRLFYARQRLRTLMQDQMEQGKDS